ncbi:zinc finger protein 37-like [Portunus trituberculatus]|uniref:zinc finger protein 37-like n=1 Tax=Portunus trituberculatus TaxID=210409 RepID=UPI001E1D103D|nr:zinc finger protein 37-like [Portunus trituberculatus]
MEKAAIPPPEGVGGGGKEAGSEGTMPPLLSAKRTDDAKTLSSSTVQNVVKAAPTTTPSIRPVSLPLLTPTPSPILPSSNTSHMRLVQTPDGKKFLLTNVVNVAKPSSNKKVIFMSKGQVPAATAAPTALPTSAAPAVTPVVSANMPQTIILNPGEPRPQQPIVLRIPGLNQPIVVRQQGTKPKAATSLPTIAPQKAIAASMRPSPASTITTTAVPGPITSPAALTAGPKGPLMLVQNGTTKFKVVGKPVPVKLFPKMTKIAPKGLTPSTIPSIAFPPLKDLIKASESAPPLLTLPPAAPVKASLPNPPAYLNIKVKEEPREEDATDAQPTVKTEPEDPPEDSEVPELAIKIDDMLDVRIKEEATDEQSELLARDEQLRKVLGVTDTGDSEQDQQPHQSQAQPQQPKFYIRTPEGKLVSISSDEAKALGLNHLDKVEENQRRLKQAFTSAKAAMVSSSVASDIAAKLKSESANILIPDTVNVKDFVSCHVSPAAEKTAALLKNLAGRRLGTNGNSVLAPKSNTAIVGEFEGENGRRYLKITIETEANGREPCDVPITPMNTYQCPFCARDFKTKDHVVSHIRIHTGERPYPCEVCGKRYRQRIDIIRHMRIHTGEKPFNCGLCNASFNQKSNLRSHMRIHTGERPVQCKVCGKGFSRNTHLKQHMKLHTGEKPYQCKVCHRPFRFKSGLQAHERIHTGLKPYACSLCGRTFTQIVGLIRHERTHAGEKPFRCQSCGKSFDTRDALKSHIQKHTGERPHTCDQCPKTFTDPGALRCHRKKYHTNLLICVICLREDFKDRIELREHLRAHERQNWEETPEGELVPLTRAADRGNFISVDDTMDDDEAPARQEADESDLVQSEIVDEVNHMEVELDPDDPLEEDDESGGHNDQDSDYDEHKLRIEETDPLA